MRTSRPGLLITVLLVAAGLLLVSGVTIALSTPGEEDATPAAVPNTAASTVTEAPARSTSADSTSIASSRSTERAARDQRRVERLRRTAERRARTAPKPDAVRIAPSPAPSTARGGNRELGQQLMIAAGFDEEHWPALDSLWTRESGWNHTADNPRSSAYGIPQALTGTHAMPAGYMDDPAVQITWGLDYIRSRYGTPSRAWAHSQAHGWY